MCSTLNILICYLNCRINYSDTTAVQMQLHRSDLKGIGQMQLHRDVRQSECLKTDLADSRIIYTYTVHTTPGSERLTVVYIK